MDSELEALIHEADAQADAALAQVEERDASFVSRGLGLQASNPEISVTGDMLTGWTEREDLRAQSDFAFRALGLHFESHLDPYTKMKAAVELHEDEVVLGEAYVTRFGASPVCRSPPGSSGSSSASSNAGTSTRSTRSTSLWRCGASSGPAA